MSGDRDSQIRREKEKKDVDNNRSGGGGGGEEKTPTYLNFKVGADWLVIAASQPRVALVVQQGDILTTPENTVAPCRQTVLFATKKSTLACTHTL